MKKVILVIVLFYSIFISFGQVGWQQIFPTSKKANTFNLTLKNNFILAGSKSIPMLMEWDIFQTDSMGNIEWDTTFQRPGFGFPVCVEPTADSGYIIMGFEEPAVYFLKFNKNNSFEWESSINVNYGDITEIRSMVLAKNNNYIAIGDIETPDKGVFLLKIDNNGDTLWTKTHLRNTDSRGISIVPAIDSGYCCLARTSYLKTTLMKLNENGDTLWTKMIDSTFESSSMIATNDSCLLIAGHKGYNKIVYCKIDNYGNKLWTKEYNEDSRCKCDIIIKFS